MTITQNNNGGSKRKPSSVEIDDESVNGYSGNIKDLQSRSRHTLSIKNLSCAYRN
jgi:hypothetical protein